MNKLRGILLGCWLAATAIVLPIEAGVPVDAVEIIPSGDGVVYSRFPAGDNTGPVYVALVFNIGDALLNAGIEGMACGTIGNDFSHNVRQYLTGTNAATATISIVFVSGNDPEDSGFTAPGAGNNLVFECAVDTDTSGSLRLSATDGQSTAQSAIKPWAAFGTEEPPPAGDRDLFIERDWSTGACQPRANLVGGVYKDACNLHQASPVKTCTITGITNTNPAKVTWSSTGCANPNPACGVTTPGNPYVYRAGDEPCPYEGFTLGNVTGMNELDRHLVRCQVSGYSSAANECFLWTDGNIDSIYTSDNGVCRAGSGNKQLGPPNVSCAPVNAAGFGSFSGTVPATTWERLETQNGGAGPASTLGVKVVTSITPPSNAIGSADPVTPLRGTHFMSAHLDFWKDHSTFPGNGNKNKVRFINSLNDSAQAFDGGEKICYSEGIALPSNYEHRNGSNFDNGTNEVIHFVSIPDDPLGIVTVAIVGTNAMAEDHWYLDYMDTATGGREEVDLGTVANDIGKWTVWTLLIDPDSTTGQLKVWKSTGAPTGGTGFDKHQRTDSLVFNRNGQPVGNDNDGFRYQDRIYLHGWHHVANYMQSKDYWLGFDEGRITRFVADGGTCQDVHPFEVNLN